MDTPNTQSDPVQNQSVMQPPVPQQPQQQVLTQPAPAATEPVGTVMKEHEPMPSSSNVEVLMPHPPEAILSKEVQEAGVEKVAETPELTLEDKKAGVELAKESVPHPTDPSGMITLPMTEQEATQTIVAQKNAPVNSVVWFASLVLKHFKKMHAKLTNG